jgi:kynurenine formamidase
LEDHLKYTGIRNREKGLMNCISGLGPEAAEWLVNERHIKAVGIDTPSIDFGQSKDFLTHRFLCGSNITAYETLPFGTSARKGCLYCCRTYEDQGRQRFTAATVRLG